MKNIVIQVEKISKQYRIGEKSKHQTLQDSLVQAVKKASPRLSGEKNDANENKIIWALREVTFEVPQGEILGLIGRNGAGKSTLLKILSKITRPTAGRAKIRGRVGSLLEVGTGFHPELTGRENIYLNGAILGMKRSEIARKFDEIVAFAEINSFLDTPVKRYSSGMYVRLAFAVAAHLEPEILLVDEVLAVGDYHFQKKCLLKMGEIAQEGRTVLFISHDMNAILRLTQNCLLIEKGVVVARGNSYEVVAKYLAQDPEKVKPNTWFHLPSSGASNSKKAYFTEAAYSSHHPGLVDQAHSLGSLEIMLKIQSDSARTIDSLAIKIYTRGGTKLINADIASIGEILLLHEGENLVHFQIERLFLNPGIFVVGLWMGNSSGEIFDNLDSAFEIEVIPGEGTGMGVNPSATGTIACQFSVKQGQTMGRV